MCGRYTLTCELDDLIAEFGIEVATELSPRYNIAPTQYAPIIRSTSGTLRLDNLRWGLIPSWSKDASIGARLINARSETADSKPSFRSAFKSRRCIAPATGFYEWKKTGTGSKQPYWIHLANDRPMALAGLWETWTSDDGKPMETFTILTTTPNDKMATLHDRMPAMLSHDDVEAWLNTEATDATRLKAMLHPWQDSPLALTPVGTRVNNVRNDDSSLIEEVATEADGESGMLF
ncbi:MAG: SOS response-associated peptidase [Phycisphaerales bacterium]|nr:SOS response-associated peptidase [Phycisphaerales bacterium]MCB9857391.1 SOS response-associated peptidase [Phycisphaerales bacterium]MCB9864994.1 SOS response-associated peptidase [Phycisphaerales bacterium]